MTGIWAMLGIDGAAATAMYFLDPSFIKWVVGTGMLALFVLLALTKRGGVSIYGSQLAMLFISAIHYL